MEGLATSADGAGGKMRAALHSLAEYLSMGLMEQAVQRVVDTLVDMAVEGPLHIVDYMDPQAVRHIAVAVDMVP